MREQDFYESVRDAVRAGLPAGFEGADVSLTRQVKQNDTERTGITIRRPGESICPVIYLDDFYKQFEEGKGIDALAGQILETRMSLEGGIAEQINPQMFADYDAVRPHLQMRAFDTEKNEKRLEGIVHYCFGDYTAGYSIMLGNSAEKSMSVMITPAMMDMWGISKRRLHDDTILADLSRGPVLADMGSMMMSFGEGTECRNFLDEKGPLDPGVLEMPMFVLTSREKMHGAGLILNPVIQQKIALIMGGDYYVLPSSIHEVLIVPQSGDHNARELSEMVHEINRSMVAPDEVLSDKVQIYDTRRKALVNAQDHERMQKRAPMPEKAKSI